jgi:hypothetical protein
MRRSGIVLILVLICACFLFWLNKMQLHSNRTNVLQSGEEVSPVREHTSTASNADASGSEPPAIRASGGQDRINQMRADLEKSSADWSASIRFYGKVVDEATNPVANAQIELSWTDLSLTGNSAAHTTSDINGFFSLEGVTGKNLIVRVSKQGYYAFQPFGLAFNYSGEAQNFSPDGSKPVIFMLKRKGLAEPLIHVAGKFSIPKNGQQVDIDLSSGKQVAPGTGSLRVQCWTHDEAVSPGEKYDWRCRIGINGGSLVISTNDLDFIAPVDGYLPTDEIDMPVSLNEGWSRFAKRRYFFKLRDGTYGRISFEMVAFNDHFFKLEAFLNPSGSGNLEFDPSKEISGNQ